MIDGRVLSSVRVVVAMPRKCQLDRHDTVTQLTAITCNLLVTYHTLTVTRIDLSLLLSLSLSLYLFLSSFLSPGQRCATTLPPFRSENFNSSYNLSDQTSLFCHSQHNTNGKIHDKKPLYSVTGGTPRSLMLSLYGLAMQQRKSTRL